MFEYVPSARTFISRLGSAPGEGVKLSPTLVAPGWFGGRSSPWVSSRSRSPGGAKQLYGVRPARPERELIFNCSRGAGKSRVVSVLADHHAVTGPGSLSLIVSRAERQAREVHRYCRQGMDALGWPVPVGPTDNKQGIDLQNGSRIVAVPGTEATMRSYQGVTLLKSPPV
jgi:hypothetical protein